MISVYVEELFVPIFKFLVCIGFVFLIGALINIIIDKIKGVSKQDLLKERNISNCDIDVLVNSFNNIKGYKKIITYNKYIIRITEYEIDAILVCDYYGILSGKENDATWNFKNGERNEVVINPLLDFEKYLQNVQNKIGNYEIKKYILLGGNTMLNISFKNIRTLRRNNVYYFLSTRKNGKKYSINEIDDIYQKILM